MSGRAALIQDQAPWWLPGGHLQTIWPVWHAAVAPPAPGIAYRRERWTTPDGDFIDLDWLDAAADADVETLLVLFHGLEGSSQSHYARSFAAVAQAHGWRYVVPHFRGCSGELNLAPRAYHSGDHEEVDWVLRRLRQRHPGRLLAVGVSLGGNALLRWAEEAGSQAGQCVTALASVSAPVDLAASGRAIGRGFGRQVYTRRFLQSMKPKALKKLAQHPGLFSAAKLQAVSDLYEFDNVFTAPLHGFKNTEDYWARASAKPRLAQIRIPTLLLNALNDPFIPAHSLPQPGTVGPLVSLWQPRHGGHVGFSQGPWPGQLRSLPEAVAGWLAGQGGHHG
jgi:predicted alpha/beta-fold hydrolase